MDYYHSCLHTHVNATAPPTLNCCTHAHTLLGARAKMGWVH